MKQTETDWALVLFDSNWKLFLFDSRTPCSHQWVGDVGLQGRRPQSWLQDRSSSQSISWHTQQSHILIILLFFSSVYSLPTFTHFQTNPFGPLYCTMARSRIKIWERLGRGLGLLALWSHQKGHHRQRGSTSGTGQVIPVAGAGMFGGPV